MTWVRPGGEGLWLRALIFSISMLILVAVGPGWAAPRSAQATPETRAVGSFGSGASIVWLSPAREGRGQALLELREPELRERLGARPDPERFRIVTGLSQVRVQSVVPLQGTSELASTLIAFDASRSFAPYLASSVEMARSFSQASATAPPFEASVVLFGTEIETLGAARSASELTTLLDTVPRRAKGHPITRLKSFLEQCVEMAAAGNPAGQAGVRQVILFTDAGEESAAWSMERVVERARALGVSVHVVLFRPGKVSAGLATRMDEMKLLAERTGGGLIQGGLDPDARTRMETLARTRERCYRLNLSFCEAENLGIFKDDQLSIELLEGGARVAWTEPRSFSLQLGEQAARPCTALEPLAQSTPGSGSGDPTSAPTELDPKKTSLREAGEGVCGLLGGAGALLAAFLVFLAFLLLFLRRSKPPVAVAPSPPAPVVTPPSPTPVPLLPAAPPLADPLGMADIPETLLRVSKGLPGFEGPRRLHRETMVIGREPGAEVDLVLAHPRVSSPHLRVTLGREGSILLTDLGSTNGTWIDEKRLPAMVPVRVAPGVIVGLSRDLLILFEQPGRNRAPAVVPSVPAPGLAEKPVVPTRSAAPTIFAPLGRGPGGENDPT